MQIILSPAKNINSSFEKSITPKSYPNFLNDSKKLISVLKKMKVEELMKLMNINPKLANLNSQRYKNWDINHNENTTKPAMYLFNGAAYLGLKATDFNIDEQEYAHKHLLILSGLYGILRAMDGIQPYRLEMGTKLKQAKFDNLYQFWGDKLTRFLKNNMNLANDDVLVNLASNEYFNSINTKKLDYRIITPVFKDFKNGEYKLISFYFKKARGMMTKYIIQNKIKNPDDLKLFDAGGYIYNDLLTVGDKWLFTRD